MDSVLEAIKVWYRGGDHGRLLMGTQTMMQGLDSVVASDCPEVNIRQRKQLRYQCGEHHTFRLYREERLRCNGGFPKECPPVRAKSEFDGLRYGIIEPGAEKYGVRKLVAWSRFENCTWFGCAGRGEEKYQRRERQGWCQTGLPPNDK
ncbi:unnamed protein product [Prorocentrum cordatum]|uniref:Uncharacterized protein n=1 Tax=Prorocentrum cordatum TaxID=2364126 RepID=A0ABN9SED9_9DINO|nr:unnamed protein product [Polarella glacialis]